MWRIVGRAAEAAIDGGRDARPSAHRGESVWRRDVLDAARPARPLAPRR
jgi:hypothetical protein